ncbi:hypothetical protein LSCM1_06427 [Leishmania martiniquensis]|uniref:Uncharacterized protein n=1 Tax=Leishmania martiniquensis TaxID=1580590 RepID=A0A836KNV3_9TRYP|nr:hypothetical protein LSCM1_06427 [Leishmania martiniquensis]
MQRDAYATIVRLRNRRKTPVRILQLNGAVFTENLVEDFFVGYRNRRLALMTHTPGQDPRLPRLPKDVIVPDYKTFLQIHQPHFMYRLLPLLSADVEAFAAMQGICASPGSPFTIEDRLESQLLNYRLSKLCAGRDKICEFFKDYTNPAELQMPAATRTLPIQGVFFQGLLVHEEAVGRRPPAKSVKLPAAVNAMAVVSSSTGTGGIGGNTTASADPVGSGATAVGSSDKSLDGTHRAPCRKGAAASIAAFLTTHDVLSEAAITQRALMAKFFHSDLYHQFASSVITSKLRSFDEQMHFMAVKRLCAGRMCTADTMRTRAHLLNLARKENLHVYEKVSEGEYVYATV